MRRWTKVLDKILYYLNSFANYIMANLFKLQNLKI